MTTIETPQTHADKALHHLTPDDRWGRTPSTNHSDFILQRLRTDAQLATAHALLAIREELAETRGEIAALRTDLADIASAIRDLTTVVAVLAASVTKAGVDGAEALTSISTGLDELAKDRVDIGRVGLAVDGLAAEVADLRASRRRHPWFRRADAVLREGR